LRHSSGLNSLLAIDTESSILYILTYDTFTMSQVTLPQFQAYQKAFDYFNEVLFKNELPGVFLNFSRMPSAHGFFAPKRWYNQNKAIYHEISLTPTSMDRTPKEVFATLVHEMVHHWQECFGTPSRRGYHNEEWADKMEEVGLIPTDNGSIEGKRTGQRVTHVIKAGGAFDKAFNQMAKEWSLPFQCTEGRFAGQDPEEEDEIKSLRKSQLEEREKKRKIKYSCSTCGVNAWGKPELNIVCGECGVQLTSKSF
jgi:hypothetical protein